MPIKTKGICIVTVMDPDSNAPVEVEIRKLESGPMVGIDGSWLANDEGTTYSPFDRGIALNIPDNEPANPNFRSYDCTQPPNQFTRENIQAIMQQDSYDEGRLEAFLQALFKDSPETVTLGGILRDLYVSWQQLGRKTYTG